MRVNFSILIQQIFTTTYTLSGIFFVPLEIIRMNLTSFHGHHILILAISYRDNFLLHPIGHAIEDVLLRLSAGKALPQEAQHGQVIVGSQAVQVTAPRVGCGDGPILLDVGQEFLDGVVTFTPCLVNITVALHGYQHP